MPYPASRYVKNRPVVSILVTFDQNHDSRQVKYDSGVFLTLSYIYENVTEVVTMDKK